MGGFWQSVLMSSRTIRYTALPAITAFALFFQGVAACASTLLFIGNSFTFAEGSPVHFYHPETVNDLNGGGVGGVVGAVVGIKAARLMVPREVAEGVCPAAGMESSCTVRSA